MMMLLSLGVALVLSARLRRRITGPVEVLAAVADDIVTRRDPSLRAPPTPLEEFAVVVNAFNSVLDQSEKNENALRVANRRKDDFLATLAHELRNPLAPIRHAARLLGIKGLDPAQGQTARDIIGRQVARMALLLDDLLEVSRITRGRLELRKETVPLVELVKTAVETSRPLIESRHQQFTMRLPDAPVELEVDPLRISQALSNLLTNAAKYTDDGGRIHLEVRCASGGIQFSVSDNGIGIPAAALPTIFEMFSQVDSAIDRSEGGLGIGLALVQGLVALHGGTVEARSEGAGRGSTFTIRLPGSARPPSASEAARQIPARAPRSHGRVLIIDDNLDAATTLAMVLRTYGHVVTTAESGAKGLALGEQQQPDAVILDIGMPEMNGYEVAQRIRRSPWGRSVLLLALTGWGQKEDIERAHAAGFDSHMTKPADPEHIEALLDAFLGSRRAGQDQREASH
jgi:signal transduction histidine kinase/ActR/RegA family two-component response regulator